VAVKRDQEPNDKLDFQVLRVKEMEVPLVPQPGPGPEVLRLRSEFLAGKNLSAADLKRIIIASDEGGGNGNCYGC